MNRIAATPRVSVVITCFNLAHFIGDAIKSVLAQDYAGDVEIIVVDDCSTDGSANVVRSFAGLRLVRMPRNSGVLLATLRGLDEVKTDLVFFLDGDDIWEPDKLRLCVRAFEQNPECLLVTHDLYFADAEGNALQMASRPAAVLGPLDDRQRSEAIIGGLQRQDDYIWLGSAWGVRREKGGFAEFAAWARNLPDPANTYQDWPLAMWLASLPGAQAAYVPKKLFRYRLHGANYSGGVGGAGKALRNFVRARNTSSAMLRLAVDRQADGKAKSVLEQRVRAYEYLARLYSGHRWRALRSFPAAVPDFLRRASLAKELLRLVAVGVFGAQRAERTRELAAAKRQQRPRASGRTP